MRTVNLIYLLFCLLICHVFVDATRNIERKKRHIQDLLDFSYFKQDIVNKFHDLYSLESNEVRTEKALPSSDIACEPCNSKECQDLSNYFDGNMNEAVDPCEDFYEFACGNFSMNSVLYPDTIMESTFTIAGKKIKDKIFNDLEHHENPYKLKTFDKVKNFYENCKNEKKGNTDGVDYFLEQVKEFGGWPVLAGNKWNEDNFEWISLLSKMRSRGFKINYPYTITMATLPVISAPSVNKYLELAAATGKVNQIVKAYYSKMVSLAVMLGADEEVALKEMMEVLAFELKLMKLKVLYEGTKSLVNVKVKHLSMVYPTTDWVKLFNTLSNPYDNYFKKDTDIILTNVRLIVSLNQLLKNTPKRVQANYMFWKVFFDSISYMSDDYVKVISRMDRDTLCKEKVMNNFQIAVGALYIRKYFNINSREGAIKLLSDIKRQFPRQISGGPEAMALRTHIKEVFSTMKTIVGYPDDLMNDTVLEEYYSELEINKGSFLSSSLNLTRHGEQRKRVYDPEDWANNQEFLLIPNAAYNLVLKSVEISTALLQSPFYGSKNPAYMNYGGMGFVVGHELAHALYLDEGVMAHEEERFNCILKQYSKHVEDSDFRNVHENIADNGGIKAAYYAYTELGRQKGFKDKCLPGMKYTPQQMFWISTSSVFCSAENKELSFAIADEHSPHKIRINVAFSNMKEFSRDFKCKPGSKMNPKLRCLFNK